MKTEKKLEKCQVRLTVELETDEIIPIVRKVEGTFMREAQLPGFRKGKVPLQLIRKEFAKGLEEETRRAIFQTKYPEAVKAEGIEEVALADVAEFKYDGSGASFVAVVDVKPVFDVPNYKGLKIAPAVTEVDDAVLAEQMERMRAAYAKYEDAKEGEAVAAGDFVQIDYDGTVDGKPILEINPEAKIVAGGKGFWTQVEEGRFLPEILDAVVGMRIGETKGDVAATFDKEAAPEGLKGAKAVYAVTLKAFRRRIMPTDAELVEKANAESLEKLTEKMRDSLAKQQAANEAMRRENEVVEQLLAKADFDVPQTLVRRAMDHYLEELSQRAQYAGLDAAYFEKNKDKILADAEARATRQVRLWYVIDAIAAAEKIEAKDDEKGKKVLAFVLDNAKA